MLITRAVCCSDNYLVNEVQFTARPSRQKIDAMRLSARLLAGEQIDDDYHWRSAIAFGNFEEIRNPSDRRTILSKLLCRFRN